MIDAGQLLADLQRLLKILENDLRQRCKDNADVSARVQAEYNKAKSAGRTSQAYEVWRDEFITQVAVSWILACVFVRFIEDNRMLDDAQAARVWLAGPGERLQLARDQSTIYFRTNPKETIREYLEHVFHAVANPTGRRPIPVVHALFDEVHNPLWRLGLSGDGATALLNFWQQIEPETGTLKYDFTDENWNTRFLGDLYQNLSAEARKKYALLQTPVFVEEFILDRTLTPAINDFGYYAVRLIDPTCGSGHFLLGAFKRLFELWVQNEPGVNAPELARRALAQVYGVDLNPYAIAIARFRLLIAALNASGIERLQDAPVFEFNLAVGDSLLHGSRAIQGVRGDIGAVRRNLYDDRLQHHYATEDAEELKRILQAGHYQAVVGNPPYITVKDAALNNAYRERFGSCHMKYSLVVPFMERFFDLAIRGGNGDRAGYVGMITSNSFMKREFGKKLIEQYFPRWDLTHVIDTAGAYIPGHGTPTVILFGRHQEPLADKIRTVMGIKGEPSTPSEPSRGQVWTSITEHIDVAGTTTEFLSISDTARTSFHRHPWSIGGGGAAELKETIDDSALKKLDELVESIGFMAITGEDDFYVALPTLLTREKVPHRVFCTGDEVRDWQIHSKEAIAFVYDPDSIQLPAIQLNGTTGLAKYSWPFRVILRKRNMFGKTPEGHGFQWYEYMQFIRSRVNSPFLIPFAEVATHNHFVLDRGEKVFKQTAPVIKLPNGSTEQDYLALLGLLNSSMACFWMKQVAHQKQMMGGDGIRIISKSKVPYAFSGTQLGQLPIPSTFFNGQLRERLIALSQLMDNCSRRLSLLSAEHVIDESLLGDITVMRGTWQKYLDERARLRAQMIFLQEEIDFTVYCLFGLADESLLSSATEPFGALLEAGERPFCIIAQNNEEGFTVPAEVPREWPIELRTLWQQRIDATNASPELKIIEDAHYKRRWIGRQGLFNHTRNTDEMTDACKEWLLNRLEDSNYWLREELTTTARLADRVRKDAEFMQVAEMYRGRSDFDVAKLVAELVKSEAVPFLPILRYKPTGLRNRHVWEQVWDMQRKEDAIDARIKLSKDDPQRLTGDEAKRLKAEQVGDIPVPPKYKSTDFLEGTFWRLRGKLDVPKERFVSYPHSERDADPSLVIGWAGWDHLQQAKALAAYYQQMKANEGWGPTRLVPLLSGIMELLPWLMQWHNEVDPTYGIGMGDFFKGFVEEEARALGLTLNKIRDWTRSEKLTTI